MCELVIGGSAVVAADGTSALVGVLRHNQRDGKVCMTIEQLARQSDLSPWSVRRMLGRLCEQGLLTLVGRRGKVPVYRLPGYEPQEQEPEPDLPELDEQTRTDYARRASALAERYGGGQVLPEPIAFGSCADCGASGRQLYPYALLPLCRDCYRPRANARKQSDLAGELLQRVR